MKRQWAILLILAALTFPLGAQPEAEAIPEFDRSTWGRWLDADRDCFDTRHASIRDASKPEALATNQKGRVCRAVAGAWVDLWTGAAFSGSARQLHADHHFVSLSEAHASGGHAWNYAKKLGFYNDSSNVRALLARSNMSKGGADVSESRGRPADRSYWCEFSSGVYRTKAKWGLTIDDEELKWLDAMQAECPGRDLARRVARLERVVKSLGGVIDD